MITPPKLHHGLGHDRSTLQTALGETTTGCAAPAPDTWDSASMEAMMGGPFEISPDGATLTLNPRGAPTYIFKRH